MPSRLTFLRFCGESPTSSASPPQWIAAKSMYMRVQDHSMSVTPHYLANHSITSCGYNKSICQVRPFGFMFDTPPLTANAASKHYLSDPIKAVHDALNSITLTNPSVLLDLQNKIIYRNPSSIKDPRNVSVVCGGGSGHEPGFAGFVGSGLLVGSIQPIISSNRQPCVGNILTWVAFLD